MKQSLFLFIASLLLFSSCEKEEPSTGQNGCPSTNNSSTINSQDLLNCKYLQGTYWVYIDSVNLQTDSTYITIANQGFVSDNCNNAFEAHSFETVSSPSQATEKYSVVQGGLYKNTSGANTGTLIYNDYSYAVSYNNFDIIKLDSFFVYDQYYYDVLMATVTNDYSEEQDQSVYYMNSDYGFLRHEIYDNGSLISNRILQQKNIVR